MTSDETRAFLDRFAAAWERQDVAALSACYTDTCQIVSPMFHTIKSRVKAEASYRNLFETFSGSTIQVDDVIVDGNDGTRAAMVWTSKTTHRGEMFGVPATGRTVEITIAFIFTFVDGRIAKEVRIYDFTKMLLFLGVLKAKPT